MARRREPRHTTPGLSNKIIIADRGGEWLYYKGLVDGERRWVHELRSSEALRMTYVEALDLLPSMQEAMPTRTISIQTV